MTNDIMDNMDNIITIYDYTNTIVNDALCPYHKTVCPSKPLLKTSLKLKPLPLPKEIIENPPTLSTPHNRPPKISKIQTRTPQTKRKLEEKFETQTPPSPTPTNTKKLNTIGETQHILTTP